MDAAWVTLLVFLAVAIGFSFLCSILEAVVLSITPSFVATQTGSFAKRLEALKRDIDKPLSAILTLNTFAHTVGAAGVGAAAQDIWGEESLTIVSAVATLLILIGSEIIPKTLGAVYWRRLAYPVVVLTRWLTILLLPLVWLCQLLTRLLRRGEQTSVLSRTDVRQVAGLGYRDGLVHRYEHDIISNLMLKEQVTTREIMVPREEIVALDRERPVRALDRSSPAWYVSRIPVYAGALDRVSGYVLKDEVLVEQILGHRERPLASLARPIVSVRGEETLVTLHRRLIEAHEHIAMVRDAEGRLIGLVTMEDVIEELLGREIVDESDRARGAE